MSGDEELPETAASVLPGTPRIASLDALLREIDGLRLSLETDLSIAAAAVEAGAPAVAVEVVEAQQDGVRAFEQRALGHLAELAAHAPEVAVGRRRRHWATTSLAPLVAAAAAVGLFFAVGPHDAGSTLATGSTSTVSANTLGQLTQLSADGGSTAEVKAAATRLNDQLAVVAQDAAQDPQAAIKALSMLTAAQQVLLHDSHSGAMADVLAQQLALINQITAALAPGVGLPPVVPTPVTLPEHPKLPTLQQLPLPTASPSPRPAAKPKASASAKPTSKPSSKPSSAPSPSSTTQSVLPNGANASNPFG